MCVYIYVHIHIYVLFQEELLVKMKAVLEINLLVSNCVYFWLYWYETHCKIFTVEHTDH